jgi:protein-disulfide isomerase
MTQQQKPRPVNYPKKRQAERRPRSRAVETQPRSRARLYFAATGFAALLAAVLVIVSQFGNSGTRATNPATAQLTGVADNFTLFAGIPQHGAVLGSPRAPVTLVEYADLQCPYCGEFARNALPSLVTEYVRTSKVRLVFRGLAFVGPDSEAALRGALAAGQQNRLWSFVHLVYANQGTENTGWVTDGFIRSVAAQIAGVNVTRLVTDAQTPSVTQEIASAQRLATSDSVNSTPSFFVGRTGSALTRLGISSLDPAAFRPTLDRLVKG